MIAAAISVLSASGTGQHTSRSRAGKRHVTPVAFGERMQMSLMVAAAESLGGRHMRRTQIRKLGKQVLMRAHAIGLHLAIGEDGQELIEDVVCECPPVA